MVQLEGFWRQLTKAGSAEASDVPENAETFVWIEGIEGAEQWSWTRIVAVVAVPAFVLAMLVSVPFAKGQVESQLRAATLNDLATLGVDESRVDVRFNYRDGTISGFLPYDVSPEMVAEAVDHPMIGQLNVLAGVEQVGIRPETIGPVEVQASYSGERVTLIGTVLDQEQYDAIYAAAAVAAPGAELDDRLQVTGLDPQVDGAGDRIADFVEALGALKDARQWLVQLNDNSLRVDAGVSDEETAQALGRLEEQLDAVPTVLAVTVLERFDVARRAAASPREVEELQRRLDRLEDEILANVVFAEGETDLTAGAKETLDEVAGILRSVPEPALEIVGHTDNSGSRDSRRALSHRQAARVRAYLASEGIDVQRLRARGAGSSDPVASNQDDEGRAANRRITFVALSEF